MRIDLLGCRVLDFFPSVEATEGFQAGEWQGLIDSIRNAAGYWWMTDLWGQVGLHRAERGVRRL